MPIQVTYPGVYVQEIPGGQPAVAGVSTASTAFIDFFARGPMSQPTRVTSTQEFDRLFGGLHTLSEASYGIRQYFLNGGQEAWIIRTGDGKATKATLGVAIKTPGLPARVQASLEDFQAAQAAAAQARKAAEAASAALGKLQVPDLTDQEREEGTEALRGSADDAARATQAAAEATRQAAIQAQAASQELALAIAKVEAASSPVADRVSMAAEKSADGASAASDAAGATSSITGVALSARDLATAALQAGSAARAAQTAASSLNDALAAITAAETAAKATGTAQGKAQAAKDLTSAQTAASDAASQAATAAAQAQAGAQKVAAAAQTLLSRLNADAGAQAELSNARQLINAAAPLDTLKASQKTFADLNTAINGLGATPTAAQLKAQQGALDKAVQAQQDATNAAKSVAVTDAEKQTQTDAVTALDALTAPLKAAQDALAAFPKEGDPTADQVTAATTAFTNLKTPLTAVDPKLTALEGVKSLTDAAAARDGNPQAKALAAQDLYNSQSDPLAKAQADVKAANDNLATVQAANPGKDPKADDAPQALKDAQKRVDDANTALTTAQTNVITARTSFYQTYKDLPAISQAQQIVTDANAAAQAAGAAADAASAAEWDAQTALDLKGAQGAAQSALDAANQAKAVASGDPSKTVSPIVKELVTAYLPAVLSTAAAAANQAAYLAGNTPKDGQPPPATPVVKGAIDAINAAMKAARTASVSATGAAQDAKVAADNVASAGPTLLARAAINSAAQAQKDTAEVIKTAKSVQIKVNQANTAALLSVAPATAAAKAAGAPPNDLQSGVNTALDTAQKALNAATNAQAAAESVEEAAVATANVSVQAATSADVAAQAAEAAVVANEEAIQDPLLTVAAVNEGEWGNNLQIKIQVLGTNFSVDVAEIVMQNGVARTVSSEHYSNLTLDAGAAANRRALDVVNHNSKLVQLSQFGPKIDGAYPATVDGTMLAGGTNGGLADPDQIISAMYTLDTIEPAIFNLLCIPAVGNMDDAHAFALIPAAHVYCQKKRAFFIVDIPASVDTVEKMSKWKDSYANAQAYSMAVYFPRLIIPDSLNDYRPRNVGASGTLAGIYARTDTARGVWKAPAGVDAVLQGAEVAVKLNDDLNGQLNPYGVNVLRSFPIYGNIAWGARTLAGADALSSEYKYINVRRLMNYIEESVFRSLKWAVFEPNNETLWTKIRLQINGFLAGLFADGAFQGATPAASYFVQCDGKTTTPLDIDLGVVNVLVGVAPVKPAEFIVLSFQQIAGQASA